MRVLERRFFTLVLREPSTEFLEPPFRTIVEPS